MSDDITPPGFGTKLLPAPLPEGEKLTPERLESLLNLMQRWLADTHAPDNPVWCEARKAVPAIRKFLSERGYEPKPVWVPLALRGARKGVSIEEIDSMEAAKRRIRELEKTIAAFYGEAGAPEPEGPGPGLDDDATLF